MDISNYLFEQAKMNAVRDMEGKSLIVPTEEQLREIFHPRQIINPATLQVTGVL